MNDAQNRNQRQEREKSSGPENAISENSQRLTLAEYLKANPDFMGVIIDGQFFPNPKRPPN
jgi:hypothetical protein